MVTHELMEAELMRANKKKMYVCVTEREKEKGASDRAMEEILLQVMNVTLSFLLYDPHAFANYPDSKRSALSLLPTRDPLGSSAKRWPCYRNHQGQWLLPEIITL